MELWTSEQPTEGTWWLAINPKFACSRVVAVYFDEDSLTGHRFIRTLGIMGERILSRYLEGAMWMPYKSPESPFK